MSQIVIRPYRQTDEESVLDICYRTGYMGEDLTGRHSFNDRQLFGYLFCLYYLLYESNHCFVAEEKTGEAKVVGYIVGTADSKRQAIQFALKMVWRIALRLLLYTSWKHPESARAVFFLRKNAGVERSPQQLRLYEDYPAHLHINVLPEYQHCGVGSKLLDTFEDHMRRSNVPGIHLRTSNRNRKAVPFYYRKQYVLLSEEKLWIWEDAGDTKSLLFAKKLV